ncbi:RepA [Plectonema cf. radiosum LEGE 06105]|uniref:RepA n=1 Tax=Plectonema cf. radiosum LEGE 06105 TaxID=945769 RepID=A0A8J7K5C9_9CYAN|nr:RepA [Plectonema radiosum]MBE9217012.1 RepA [Plectonema cf. radiosum LEGE 06105]
MRIHSRIARNPWARLWYLCKGVDKDGSGHVKIPLEVIEILLDSDKTTIYRYLQDGKQVGAFWKYRVKRGMVEVYLGSLGKVCWNLNLRNWGTVATVPLSLVITNIREVTTGIVTQQFQQKSRYAVDRKLKPEHRKYFGTPHPNELFVKQVGQSLLKPAVGEVPCVLHVSEKRIFVSKNFPVFGTSQKTISNEFGIHRVTVQRHQKTLGIERRQLCQAKGEYTHLKLALEHESLEFNALDPMGTGKDTKIGFKVLEDKKVLFSDGVPHGSKKRIPNTYTTSVDGLQQRLFTTGKKYKKTWLAKCNIYRETFTLTTMRYAKRKFHYNLSRGVYGNCHTPDVTVIEKIVPGVQHPLCERDDCLTRI